MNITKFFDTFNVFTYQDFVSENWLNAFYELLGSSLRASFPKTSRKRLSYPHTLLFFAYDASDHQKKQFAKKWVQNLTTKEAQPTRWQLQNLEQSFELDRIFFINIRHTNCLSDSFIRLKYLNVNSLTQSMRHKSSVFSSSDDISKAFNAFLA